MAKSLAIYNPTGKVGLGQNPFGKDVANMELYQALTRYGGYDPLTILTHAAVSVITANTTRAPMPVAMSRRV